MLDRTNKLFICLPALKRCAFTVLDDQVANGADAAQSRQSDFDAIQRIVGRANVPSCENAAPSVSISPYCAQ